MSALSAYVQPRIDTGYAAGETLVFPSQLAAEYWRSASLHRWASSGIRSVVRSDRFISWDTFKEQTSSSRKDRAPANSALRRLAARKLASDNARTPFLSRIIPTEYARDSILFADLIRQGIPGLRTLLERQESLDGALKEDVRQLTERYQNMLDATGYFEPSWVPPEIHTAGRQYVIFFPELIEDFEEFASLVRERPELTEVPLPDGLDEHAATVCEYPDALIELRDVLDRIETLLDSGVPPSDMAITCGDLDSLRDEIEREGRRRSLPLGLRAGVRLSDHPAGQIFARIADCVETDFHADSVKRLLHHAAVPWRSPKLMHLVARAGVDHGCLGGGARPAAGWHELFEAGFGRDFRQRLEACGVGSDDVVGSFTSLETALRRIAGADSFEELRTAVYRFLGQFVDTEQWGAEVEPVFQRCMTVLAEWIETERRSNLPADEPFSLFRASLAESIYVRKGDVTGVAVYPYRVSAGICPAHHFVIGASRQATTIPEARLPFLREDEREHIEGSDMYGNGVDPTPAFHRAYTVSGESVRISYSLKTKGGAQIAPPGILSSVPGNPDRFDVERHAIAASTPSAAEAATSAGGRRTANDFPLPLYPVQRTGYRAHYLRTAVKSEEGEVRDLRSKPVSDAMIQSCCEGFLSEDLRIRLSPSTIENMTRAPFSLLLSRAAGVDDERWALTLSDPLSEGSLLHRLISVIEADLTRTQTPYADVDFAELETAVGAELERYFAAKAVSDSPVPARFLRMQEGAFRRQTKNVFERLARSFPTFVADAQEWKMSVQLDEGVELSGRADSIARAEGRTLIIDFKRSGASLPSVQAVSSFGSPQLPLYVFMAEKLGRQVAHAVYVAAADGKVRVAVGERPANLDKRNAVGIDENQWEQSRDALADHVAGVAARIDDGDFRCPEPWFGCDDCRTRAICRAKYSHRARTEGT